MVKLILNEIRYYQWIKNLIIFAALLFSDNIFNYSKFIKTIFGFVVFCFISSAIYILNDIVDIEKDKVHPVKRFRPLASGELSISTAVVIFIILILLSILLLQFTNNYFKIIVLSYFVLMLAYSFLLKNIVIADVITIAFGFLLRAIAGAELIQVEISHWLIICTFLLALLLGLGKRRSEIINLGDNAGEFKKILSKYNVNLIEQFISIVSSTVLIAYILYAFDARTITKLSDNMKFTIPFVVYGILRYLYLMHNNKSTETPESIILKDKPTLLNLLLWVCSVMIVLYFRK